MNPSPIDYDSLIKKLNTNHIYKIKKIMDKDKCSGLEIFSSGLMEQRRREIIRDVCGDRFKIDYFPNDEFFVVKLISVPAGKGH